MKTTSALLLCPLFFAAVTGCEKKSETPTVIVKTSEEMPTPATKTMETSNLAGDIDDYIAAPTAENAAEVEKAFAKLDGEIAELKSRVASTSGSDQVEAQTKLSNLMISREQEMARFNAIKMSTAVTPAVDTRTGAEKVESTLNKVGESIENGAEKVGDTLQKGAENVEDKVKDATH